MLYGSTPALGTIAPPARVPQNPDIKIKENYSSHGVSWAEPGNCIIDKAQCIEFDF